MWIPVMIVPARQSSLVSKLCTVVYFTVWRVKESDEVEDEGDTVEPLKPAKKKLKKQQTSKKRKRPQQTNDSKKTRVH